MSDSKAKSQPAKPALTPEQQAQVAADAAYWQTLPMSRIPRSPFPPTATADDVVQHYLTQSDSSASFVAHWRGRTIMITGVGPDGIGAPTVAAFARIPEVTIVLVVRNAKTAEPVRQAVLASPSTKAKAIEVRIADNMSLRSVRALAEEWGRRPLHALVLNAGIMACPYQLTEDGNESQFQTNHLAHFLLATSLLPALRAGWTKEFTPRVVAVSSLAHKGNGIHWSDVNWTGQGKSADQQRAYAKWPAYNQSKTANILFAREWDRRYGQSASDDTPRVIAHALHPGIIMTRLQRTLPVEEQAKLGWLDPKTGKVRAYLKTIEQGAATTVYCTLAPELEHTGCGYFEDAAITPGFVRHPLRGIARHIFDDADGRAPEKLWQMSEEMVKPKAKL